MQRLDKILSEAGVCSRRDCERFARRGLITVNGLVVRNAAEKVSEDAQIELDGQIVELRRRVVCIMNKPAGYITSTADETGRVVMELLPSNLLLQQVVPAGRLDKDTEGLLVFTNDGDLLHRLISPKSEVSKTYEVHYEGTLVPDAVEKAKQGITLKDGTVCKSADLVLSENGGCTITIREGMYHQVKRMIAALGGHVTYLRRIAVGCLELGDLEPGAVRELPAEEERLFFLQADF
ncbi:MAG: rRNA pseudouridine synthase [Spirochaetales bacterium]|nr:rRNA pseudouridine synthase [Spirochaetales bacterium]